MESVYVYVNTAQKMKFSMKDFVYKCDQICNLQRIWPHLLKKSLMENFIFCALKHESEDLKFKTCLSRNL